MHLLSADEYEFERTGCWVSALQPPPGPGWFYVEAIRAGNHGIYVIWARKRSTQAYR